MKKILIPLCVLASAFLLSGCSLQLGKSEQFAALQVTSLPKAAVFLDNKQVGETKYYNEKLKPGEYTVKLVSEEKDQAPWSGKVKLTPETLTVINWQFNQTEVTSEGETLSLEPINDKNGELTVLTSPPDGAEVRIDDKMKGLTPLIMKDISGGDHVVTLSKDGYNQRTIQANVIPGYRLTINAQLSQSPNTASPSATEASQSATLSKITAVVKDTPTGWLRVRFEPSLDASEAAKVNPGEEFPWLDEQNGWTKIEYKKGQTGWVSSQYVEKK